MTQKAVKGGPSGAQKPDNLVYASEKKSVSNKAESENQQQRPSALVFTCVHGVCLSALKSIYTYTRGGARRKVSRLAFCKVRTQTKIQMLLDRIAWPQDMNDTQIQEAYYISKQPNKITSWILQK